MLRAACAVLGEYARGCEAHQLALLPELPRLIRFARLEEAIECAGLILSGHVSRQACSDELVRAVLRLPLEHGRLTHLLTLPRALLAASEHTDATSDVSAPDRRVQRLIVQEMRAMPHARLQRLLALSVVPVSDAYGRRRGMMIAEAARGGGRDILHAELAYELQALGLLTELSHSCFAAEALCRELYPLEHAVAAITDPASSDELRASLLALSRRTHLEVEASVPRLVGGTHMALLLDYLAARVGSADAAAADQLGDAEADDTLSAPTSRPPVDPFLVRAAVPFCLSFFMKGYRAASASKELKAAAARCGTALDRSPLTRSGRLPGADRLLAALWRLELLPSGVLHSLGRELQDGEAAERELQSVSEPGGASDETVAARAGTSAEWHSRRWEKLVAELQSNETVSQAMASDFARAARLLQPPAADVLPHAAAQDKSSDGSDLAVASQRNLEWLLGLLVRLPARSTARHRARPFSASSASGVVGWFTCR